MSDGPHKSLDMTRGWKKLAERADNRAFAPEEVRDALPEALAQDWRGEVPDRACRRVREILGDNQCSLFGDERIEQLESLRGEIAGYNLGNVFLDYASEAAAQGRYGDKAVAEAASKALADRATRGARQVEEHYCRQSTHHRGIQVRERIESGVMQSNLAGLAERLVGIGKSDALRLPKRTGLDEGVQL